jgi:hypothetical protein
MAKRHSFRRTNSGIQEETLGIFPVGDSLDFVTYDSTTCKFTVNEKTISLLKQLSYAPIRIVAVIGEQNSGKSTLINILSKRAYTPDSLKTHMNAKEKVNVTLTRSKGSEKNGLNFYLDVKGLAETNSSGMSECVWFICQLTSLIIVNTVGVELTTLNSISSLLQTLATCRSLIDRDIPSLAWILRDTSPHILDVIAPGVLAGGKDGRAAAKDYLLSAINNFYSTYATEGLGTPITNVFKDMDCIPLPRPAGASEMSSRSDVLIMVRIFQ